MKEKIERIIDENIELKKRLKAPRYIKMIQKIAKEIITSLKKGGKVIVFGNGGSAADAQHMVCELVGRFKRERKPLAAISLTTNTSNITAISNDYSYDVSFKRQLEALASKNDIAIGISTSGEASNVIEAVKFAKKINLKTAALTGKKGGKLARLADISLIVPSDDTPRIQEAHGLLIHLLCELVENGI